MTLRARMIDESSNNGPTNLDALWAAGERVIALKTSEGTSYTWDGAHALGAHWHRLGGIVEHYHFLHPGTTASGAAQAEWFYAHVKADLGVGDRFVVDAETKGETGGEVNAFIDRCHDHAPARAGLIYGGPYFLRDNKIGAHRGWGLWLADYATSVAFIPPGWPTWTAWQFSQTATVPGVSGQVDESYIRRELLQPGLHYGERCFAVLDAKRLLTRAGFGAGLALTSMTFGSAMANQLHRFKLAHPKVWTPAEANGSVLGGTAWRVLDRYAA